MEGRKNEKKETNYKIDLKKLQIFQNTSDSKQKKEKTQENLKQPGNEKSRNNNKDTGNQSNDQIPQNISVSDNSAASIRIAKGTSIPSQGDDQKDNNQYNLLNPFNSKNVPLKSSNSNRESQIEELMPEIHSGIESSTQDNSKKTFGSDVEISTSIEETNQKMEKLMLQESKDLDQVDLLDKFLSKAGSESTEFQKQEPAPGDEIEDPMLRLDEEELDRYNENQNNTSQTGGNSENSNSMFITPRDKFGDSLNNKNSQNFNITLKMTPDAQNLKMTPQTVSNSSSNNRLPTCATTTAAQTLSTDSTIPSSLPTKATTISAPTLGPPPIKSHEEQDYDRMVSITQRQDYKNKYKYGGSFHHMIPQQNSPMLENYQMQFSYLEEPNQYFYQEDQQTIDYRGIQSEGAGVGGAGANFFSQRYGQNTHLTSQNSSVDRKSLFFGNQPGENYYYDQYSRQQAPCQPQYIGNGSNPTSSNFQNLGMHGGAGAVHSMQCQPSYGVVNHLNHLNHHQGMLMQQPMMHPQMAPSQSAFNTGYHHLNRKNMNQQSSMHQSATHFSDQMGSNQSYMYGPMQNQNDMSYYSQEPENPNYPQKNDSSNILDDSANSGFNTNNNSNVSGSNQTQMVQGTSQQTNNQRRRRKYEIQESEESKFDIILDKIQSDGRTTLMIKNIPNQYTRNMLLQTFNDKYAEAFDFFYLPIDFQNNCNMGYAFINFIDSKFIRNFYLEFNGKKWERYNSDKIRSIQYARIQGRESLEQHFMSSSVMNQQPVFLPISSQNKFEQILQAQRKNCK